MAAAGEQPADDAKRYRKAIDEMAEEFVCPITHELPVDPVTAEDGRVYEKSAIEDWFKNKQPGQLRSPVTNQPMGKRLLPAVQAKNTIKAMVTTGAITGAKADAWKKRIKDEKWIVDLQHAADAGDAVSMYQLGRASLYGSFGLTKSDSDAVVWFKRAAALDHPGGMSNLGFCYLIGNGGLRKNVSRGLVLLARAAEKGSQHACFLLGKGHKEGLFGLDVDVHEASFWFDKMQKAVKLGATQSQRDLAAAHLCEHPVPATHGSST